MHSGEEIGFQSECCQIVKFVL